MEELQTNFEEKMDAVPTGETATATDWESPRILRLYRQEARILALQMLYAMETQGVSELDSEERRNLRELRQETCEEGEAAPPKWGKLPMPIQQELERHAAIRALALVRKCAEKQPEIDAYLQDAAKNWVLARMNQIDRNLMRLAICEMSYELQEIDQGEAELRVCEAVKPAIVINEAVNLAKQFGAADSWRFVNGVLDHIAKKREMEPLTFGEEKKNVLV